MTASPHAIVICVDLFLNACDPSINNLLIESPDLSDPTRWGLSLGCIFADGDFVELDIFRHFLCGHDLGQNRIPQKKAFFICEAMGWCLLFSSPKPD